MRRSWRFTDGLLIMGLLALALIATREVWADIFDLAKRSEESSYIFLAPPMAVWLAWLRRERVRFCKPQPSPLGAVAVALGWLLIVLGQDRAVDIARDVGALLVVVGAVLTVTGTSVFVRFAAAWGGLLFVLPVPGRVRHIIAAPLQEASATITHRLLDLCAFPVEQKGNMLVINSVDVAIAEACNGMRMVAALGLIAYAFVFSFPMRPWARILLLAVSPLVAVLVNVLRLVPTTLLYGYSTTDIASTFHDFAGWGVLLVAIAIMWCVLALMRLLALPIVPYSVREES